MDGEDLFFSISGINKVFCSREEALKELKAGKHLKGARLKTFSSREEAEEFSRTAEDVTDAPPKNSAEGQDPTACPFPSLKVPALNAFRMAIEKDNSEKVRDLLESNPRYLVDCGGDLPVLLQKGCHYNALHVVARANKANMAEYLLSTLNGAEYWSKLYPSSTPAETEWRKNHVLDHYFHAFDKGKGNTALHFAAELGHEEVLSVLVAHPSADCAVRNRDGKIPADIVCERWRGEGSHKGVKKRIEELLKGLYYVPVIRPEDNSLEGVLGQPFSPQRGESPLDEGLPDDLLASPHRIVATAGPMSPSKAKEFHRHWKNSPDSSERRSRRKILCTDSDRGLERIGRKLAHQCGVSWAEYWDFLGGSFNLSTDSGLQQLENFFSSRQTMCAQQNTNNALSSDVKTQQNDLQPSTVDSTGTSNEGSFPLSPNSMDSLCAQFDTSLTVSSGEVTPPLPSVASNSNDRASEGVADGGGRQDGADKGSDEVDHFSTPQRKVLMRRSGTPVFIYGHEPSKLDKDVLLAIGETVCDSGKFPCVAYWLEQVRSYSEDAQNRWPTPATLRRRNRPLSSSPLTLGSPLGTSPRPSINMNASPLLAQTTLPRRLQNGLGLSPGFRQQLTKRFDEMVS